MKKNKWLAVLTAGVLAVGAAVATPTGSATKAEAADGEAIKFMWLGDYITDGYFGADGYRKYLYHELIEMGYNIDMVGANGGGNSYTDNGESFTYDGDHSGYSGYAIQYMTGTETRQGILETVESTDMIKTCDPDIVLLQIGTNDVLSAYNDGIEARLENLVRTIMADMTDENDVLFLTTIPYFNAITINSWLWAYGDVKWQNTEEDFANIVYGYIDSYNASIKTLVGKLQAEGLAVEYADVCSVVDKDTELQDGCHPNEAGYKDMGLYWADTLNSYLSGEKPVVTTTTAAETTTTTTTTTTETTTTDTTTTKTTTYPTTTETTTTETTTYPTTTETTTTETTTYPTTTETTTTETTTQTTTTDTTTKNHVPEQTTTEASTTTEAITTTTTYVLTGVTPDVNVGDVNGDNYISMVDVVKIRKYIVNVISKDEINILAADMDGNGSVNIMDAVRLLMYIIEAQ